MMSSVESRLQQYRAQKARERKSDPSPVDKFTGKNRNDLRKSWASYIPIMSSILSFMQSSADVNQGNDDSQPLIAKEDSLQSVGEVKTETINGVKVADLNDDDKLISKNCLNACSSDLTTRERIISALPVILKVTLWTVLWGLFIEIGFGAVYFVISLLIIMYLSMRTRPKKQGEMSAYSVFNPGVEKLDGTFTAEQFEKELRYGAGAVH